ncbi:hypothetical protein P8C59_007932 [Phyllachora maydis]|uniref:Uncharacterized protein n=1 Tax=Phyllachora maydis TaxID=1825666 RepID=A0AAD9I9F8_9PEZI|nr:hypothetical protein P8C59_007932 [Phyllachora maydis]
MPPRCECQVQRQTALATPSDLREVPEAQRLVASSRHHHASIWTHGQEQYAPWVETISLEFLDQARLQTWLPVSISLMTEPRTVSWNIIRRSAVPPPEASRPRW